MKTIGISTEKRTQAELSYEEFCLFTKAQQLFDNVILINPKQVFYKFLRNEPKPQIYLGSDNISITDVLIVRSTKGKEIATSFLVHALNACGCCILDPIERFSIGRPSKLLTTIDRHKKKVGINTYTAFDRVSSFELLKHLAMDNRFPLLAKAVTGSKGRDIYLLNDLKDAKNYVINHFRLSEYVESPVLLQDFLIFTNEFRAIFIDGDCLGVVKKILPPGEYIANASRGCKFIQADVSKIIDFVSQRISSKGLLGVDIGIDQDEQIYIIEENRAPLWKEFEKATGIDVAKEALSRLRKQV